MSESANWSKEFAAHPVHEVLNGLYGDLETLDDALVDDKAARAKLDRIRRALDYARGRLAKADQGLCVPELLQAVKAPLDQVVPHLSGAASQKAAPPLAKVLPQIPGLLQALAQVPVVEAESDVKRLADAQEHFASATDAVIRGFEESLKKERKRYAGLDSKTTATESAVSELQGTIDTQKARLDEAIAAFQKQFSEAEATRAAEHQSARTATEETAKKLLEESKAAFDSTNKKAEAEFKTQREKNEESTRGLLERMESSEKKAKDLLGIATNIAVTGEFHKTAEAEGKAADTLRKWAFFFNIVLVASVVVFLIETGSGGYSWELSISRLIMIAVLVVPARYAAQESRRHRRREGRNRRIQLELASIDPFLETLEGTKAEELKAKLADKLFGQSHLEDDGEKEHGNVFSIVHLVKDMMPKG